MTAAIATAIAATSAGAQTLSLSERVSRLEQQQAQQQPSQGGVGLVNQIQDLQSQLQQMEGRIEDLQHQVQQLQQQNKDQYLDLDSRVGKLEGKGGPPSVSSSSGPAPAASASSSAGPAVATSASPGPPGADEQAAYNAAFKSLQAGDYVTASRGFRTFTQTYPQSALAPNAFYWLGESYYVTQNYQVSLDTFQNLLKGYPNSEKAPDALLKIGYCQAEMKHYDAAQATLRAVIKKYPGTTVARLAQSRLRSVALQKNGG
ncbi:MAG TPA: tol-pal system protein YbgF [Rhodanobacteraceae bacterium]|nr:tol-pal system protein YbgF [Rhodanobacteraceae bacterium]